MRGKLTPEQQARQREGARRFQASRTPEQKAATVAKRWRTLQAKRRPPPGRLTVPTWCIEDFDEDF